LAFSGGRWGSSRIGLAGDQIGDETTPKRFPGLEGVQWRFWLLWALGNAAGWAVAPVVALGSAMPEAWIKAIVVVSGAAYGTAQWLLLRKRLRGAGWWVLFSVVR
jgi:hypothetical protein